MSLISALKDVGKTLEDFGKWFTEALPVVGAIAVAVDPEIGPIVTSVEAIVKGLQSIGKPPSADDLQSITKAVTLLTHVNSTITNGKISQAATLGLPGQNS